MSMSVGKVVVYVVILTHSVPTLSEVITVKTVSLALRLMAKDV